MAAVLFLCVAGFYWKLTLLAPVSSGLTRTPISLVRSTCLRLVSHVSGPHEWQKIRNAASLGSPNLCPCQPLSLGRRNPGPGPYPLNVAVAGAPGERPTFAGWALAW